MLTKTSRNAILAVAKIAGNGEDTYSGAAGVAEAIGAPSNYLGKLLQTLANSGVLFSQKGFGGGFKLARPAQQISLFEIVEPIERLDKWEQCFLGNSVCSDTKPCPVHLRWKQVRDAFLLFLRETSIADIESKKDMIESMQL